MRTDSSPGIMNALLELATAAATMEGDEKEEKAEDKGEDAPTQRAYSRKTRPTHTAYQKAVMTRCACPRDPSLASSVPSRGARE